jgi:hypothetical protein
MPRAVCPELDNVVANLELMPMRMNSSKSDKIGARQLDLARKLRAPGLQFQLSAFSIPAFQERPPPPSPS